MFVESNYKCQVHFFLCRKCEGFCHRQRGREVAEKESHAVVEDIDAWERFSSDDGIVEEGGFSLRRRGPGENFYCSFRRSSVISY